MFNTIFNWSIRISALAMLNFVATPFGFAAGPVLTSTVSPLKVPPITANRSHRNRKAFYGIYHCRSYSSTGIPTDVAFEISYIGHLAHAYIYRNKKLVESIVGDVVGPETDPILKAVVENTGADVLGFRSESPPQISVRTNMRVILIYNPVLKYYKSGFWLITRILDDNNTAASEKRVLENEIQCVRFL